MKKIGATIQLFMILLAYTNKADATIVTFR